ncbi:MAG: cysteine--tRNA ligase [Bacillota bacterium]|nr:cysteine--tRNA ligase [Bacillota bacterium]
MNLFNTLSREIEPFQPIEEGKVGIYTCGPTVYNYAHIGNLRTYIGEDILVKAFLAFGYDVKRVMNITDVGHLESDADDGEDKLLKGAKRENKSIREIADYYEDVFFRDCEKLNIMAPDVKVRATDCIDRYIAFVKSLEDKGYTYFANGNVYFDITKFPKYTELSRAELDSQRAASREEVSVDEHKRNVQDFVLWFTRSKFENQAMKWDSPWGTGYPGWHLECSVIALDNLGKNLDIHCGGVDHIAIHHTNEIAQTESYTGEKWVNYWWHGEFLIDEGGKMSKSSGEFVNLDLLIKKGYDPLAYRYYVLGSHYRRQLAFNFEKLDQAAAAYRKLRERCAKIAEAARMDRENGMHTEVADFGAAQPYVDRFHDALADDLNTANAMTELYHLLKADCSDVEKAGAIAAMDRVLSLSLTEPYVGGEEDPAFVEKVEALISARAAAKAEKNYAEADRIRDELTAMDVVLKDGKDGTSWQRLIK